MILFTIYDSIHLDPEPVWMTIECYNWAIGFGEQYILSTFQLVPNELKQLIDLWASYQDVEVVSICSQIKLAFALN